MSTHDEVYKLGSLKLVIIASNKIGNYNDIKTDELIFPGHFCLILSSIGE